MWLWRVAAVLVSLACFGLAFEFQLNYQIQSYYFHQRRPAMRRTAEVAFVLGWVALFEAIFVIVGRQFDKPEGAERST